MRTRWVLEILLVALPFVATDSLGGTLPDVPVQEPMRPAEPLPLERSAPGHLLPVPNVPMPSGALTPRPQRHTSFVLYSLSSEDLAKRTKVVHSLSRLCRLGAFGQQLDGWLYARTPDRRWGLAFAHGANLNDPQGRAQPGMVYFIRDQDTGRCEVRQAPQAQLGAYWIGDRYPPFKAFPGVRD